jgi:hypothetical protein
VSKKTDQPKKLKKKPLKKPNREKKTEETGLKTKKITRSSSVSVSQS